MNLGKLEYLDDLRKIWKHEEKEFTPWLAENITLLGEALGLDLEVISVEHNVGAFSLDILAKDLSFGNFVAIENQLEITDHSHLGQIITYASGVDAKTIIWISKDVREEHRKTIDWLNQNTNEDMAFFAVEIQLIKIDDSSPAPLFKIKASPNEWSKEQKVKVKSKEAFSEREEKYHNFFAKLLDMVHKEIPNLTHSKKVDYSSWKSFPTGVSSCQYIISFRIGNKMSCDLYIDSGDKEKNKEIYDKLYTLKEQIENDLGKLEWRRLDDKQACRIEAYENYTNENDMLEWSVGKLKAFKDTFASHISKIIDLK